GPPYAYLAQLKLQKQDRAGAEAVLQQAMSRTNMAPIDRARCELQLAEVHGDIRARFQAWAKLTQLEPEDATGWRALGDIAMVRHDYAQAKQAYEKASALAPDDADVFNTLGYAAAQSGDVSAAMNALKRYQALRPNEANPLDSLGDANLLFGKL